MIIIETYTSTKFKLDGIPYLKNYISEVAGNQITIFNAYDRKDVRSNWLHYSEITLNGVVYGNVADLQNALLPVIYTRASLGGATASFDLTVYEEGETPISNVNEIEVIGATVTDDGGGKVTLEVVGGGGTPTLQDVRDENPVIDVEGEEYIIFNSLGGFRGTIQDGGSSIGVMYSSSGTDGVSIYCAGAIQNNSINYPLPTGASSPLATLADITGGGAVDSVNGQTGVVVLDADDIAETATRVYVTPTQKTAITHSNRATLDAITEAFTTALKSNYDSAYTWVNTNGATVLSFISNIATTVRGTLLTGLSTISSAKVTATNTVLEAIGLLQSQATLNETNIYNVLPDRLLLGKTGWSMPTGIQSPNGFRDLGFSSSPTTGFITQGNHALSGEIGRVGFTTTTGDLCFKRRNDAYSFQNTICTIYNTFRFVTVESAHRFVFGFSKNYRFTTPSNISPTAETNFVGICKMASSDNLHFLWNDATGLANTEDSGYPCLNSANELYYIIAKQLTSSYEVTIVRYNFITNLEISRVTKVMSSDIPDRTSPDVQTVHWGTKNGATNHLVYADGGFMFDIKN